MGKYGTFPTILWGLIQESGKSLRGIAAETGISAGTLSQYGQGAKSPTAGRLETLADYFGVSADYLLGRTTVKSVKDPDAYLQAATELLELSEDALVAVTSMMPDSVRALDMLLRSANFQNALPYITEYRETLYMAEAMPHKTQLWSETVDRCDLAEFRAGEQLRFVFNEMRQNVKKEVAHAQHTEKDTKKR